MSFSGRILILPGFSLVKSWRQVVPFQRMNYTARGAERSRIVTVVLSGNSYLACGYLGFWGAVLPCSKGSPVIQQITTGDGRRRAKQCKDTGVNAEACLHPMPTVADGDSFFSTDRQERSSLRFVDGDTSIAGRGQECLLTDGVTSQGQGDLRINQPKDCEVRTPMSTDMAVARTEMDTPTTVASMVMAVASISSDNRS